MHTKYPWARAIIITGGCLCTQQLQMRGGLTSVGSYTRQQPMTSEKDFTYSRVPHHILYIAIFCHMHIFVRLLSATCVLRQDCLTLGRCHAHLGACSHACASWHRTASQALLFQFHCFSVMYISKFPCMGKALRWQL
jgi:hypothetical protein